MTLDCSASFAIAEILRDRNISILFRTGYGAVGLPEEFADRPVLTKPFCIELREKIAVALAAQHFGS